jgi:hypothetical protein
VRRRPGCGPWRGRPPVRGRPTGGRQAGHRTSGRVRHQSRPSHAAGRQACGGRTRECAGSAWATGRPAQQWREKLRSARGRTSAGARRSSGRGSNAPVADARDAAAISGGTGPDGPGDRRSPTGRQGRRAAGHVHHSAPGAADVRPAGGTVGRRYASGERRYFEFACDVPESAAGRGRSWWPGSCRPSP